MLERILREQRECRDLLLADHPEQRGLRLAISDLVAEEVLITSSDDEYQTFLASKKLYAKPCGFHVDIEDINPMLRTPAHRFQADIVQWDCARGKAANFLSTGLGKGPIQMEWCRLVSKHTGGDTLILAPLAVADQFVHDEAPKFGMHINLCESMADVKPGINITNYDRMELFDMSHFAGVSMDESSCIKDFNSKTAQYLVNKLSGTRYKLCSTATPSPNDHAELGMHAEILDVMSRAQMLAMFFEHDGGDTAKWTIKGHAKKPFWHFMASFCRCVGKPSDIDPGYDDSAYVLPRLNLVERIVSVDHSVHTDGMLFRCPDMSATGIHKEMRLTAESRAKEAAELVREKPEEPWLIWVNTDYEADAVRSVLPEAIEVKGSDTRTKKRAAIRHFLDSENDWLVSKGSIFGYGLNLQGCCNMTIMVDYSFEKLFQLIRRCWRFGQTRPVNAYIITAETEGAIMDKLRSSQARYDELQREMTEAMRNEQISERYQSADYTHSVPMEVPSWLKTESE